LPWLYKNTAIVAGWDCFISTCLLPINKGVIMKKDTNKKTSSNKEVKKPIEKKVNEIDILHKRVDDLIDDFTTAIKKVQNKLDKISNRMGLPKDWS